MLKENQIAISGRVGGIWNHQDKKFEIKSGSSQSGQKFQIFEISVAKKDGETWINGKGVKVVLWGDTDIKENSMIGVVGRLQPDNFTTKDGKEIRGNQVIADDKDLFTPKKWEQKNPSPTTETSEPANNEGNLPF